MKKHQDVAKKREQEKELLVYMVGLYCRQKHKSRSLCSNCRTLVHYAEQRIEHCPFMKEKTFCSACKSHCYGKQKRQEIKTVMRWAGPRLLLRRPVFGWRHLFISWQQMRNKKK